MKVLKSDFIHEMYLGNVYIELKIEAFIYRKLDKACRDQFDCYSSNFKALCIVSHSKSLILGQNYPIASVKHTFLFHFAPSCLSEKLEQN